MLINMMLILFYYLWQVQMMQKLHFIHEHEKTIYPGGKSDQPDK